MQWKIIYAECGCFVKCMCVHPHVCVCVRVHVRVCDSSRGARSCPGHSCMDAIRGERVTTATVQPRRVPGASEMFTGSLDLQAQGSLGHAPLSFCFRGG